MRAISWRLLSKYLPPSGERRNAVLESKRQSYQDLRQNYFKVDSQDETQQDTYRQVWERSRNSILKYSENISILKKSFYKSEQVLFVCKLYLNKKYNYFYKSFRKKRICNYCFEKDFLLFHYSFQLFYFSSNIYTNIYFIIN